MATEAPAKLDVWGLSRLVMCSLGGALVGHAGIDIDENEIQAVVGAILAIGATVWGIYVRWNARSVPLEVAVRPEIPVQSDLTGKIVTGPGTPL